ncbi:MAG: 30S ribosomal protein S3 [Desulfurococcaceae archaeon]|nr:MAG: 30S ribosomal protein S3 [Desulfurococcaceae archaeon]
MLRTKVDEYLSSVFFRAGYAGVEITKTPLGTRIIIYADRPAILIGRRGEVIRKLQTVFEKHFGIENPQITIMGVENPELNARVMASRLAVALEKGFHFRRAAFITLRRIMAAGALGAEVVVSGKLTSERAKFEKLRAGKIYRSGDQINYLVDRAVANVLLIPGIYGIEVIIVRPGRPADYIEVVQQPQAAAPAQPASTETQPGGSPGGSGGGG